MSLRHRLGLLVLVLAICLAAVLGSLGWFAAGFALLTDCTNNYSCTTSGCTPCRGASLWVNVGGIGQWVLVALGITVLVRTLRRGVPRSPLIAGLVLTVAAAATILVTSWFASTSYCRPGSAGYASSYCST